MRKYLNELSIAGILLLFIGVIIGHTAGTQYGMWPCAVGLFIALVLVVFKAMHWKEFERENKRNIVIMLITIVLLYLFMLSQ